MGGLKVDVAGGRDGTFVCVMCHATGKPGPYAPLSLVRAISAERNRVRLWLRRNYPCKYSDLRFVIAIHGANVSEEERAKAARKRISVWDDLYIDACETLYKQVGPRSRFYVFKELGCSPKTIPGAARDGRIRVPAFRIATRPDTFLFSLDPYTLLDLAYVYRLSTGQPDAYQRMLVPKKLSSIATFISEGNSFKNNIVASFDSPALFSTVRERGSRLPGVKVGEPGILSLPGEYASLWIVDGQHRLYGYARLDPEAPRLPLAVTAISDIDTSAQAKLFVDINENQKPVDPNLVWTLYLSIQTDPRNFTLARAVELLNDDGPLRDKIYIPGDSPGGKRGRRIFIANLCTNLQINDLARATRPPIPDGEDGARKLARLMCGFLRDVELASSRTWRTEFFFTNNGLGVLLPLLVSLLRNFRGEYDSRTVRPILKRAFARADSLGQPWDLRASTSSATGKARIASELEKLIVRSAGSMRYRQKIRARATASEGTETDSDVLDDLERKVRAHVQEALQARWPRAWWPARIPERVVESAQHNMQSDRQNDGGAQGDYGPIDYVDFAHWGWIINKNWEDCFRPVFKEKDLIVGKLRELEPIRRQLAHHRGEMNDMQRTRLRLYRDDITKAIARFRP